MREEQLTHELQRVGDSLPLPADLFPSRERLTAARHPWWRRPMVSAVAAAAVLLLVLGLSPAGQRTVLAAVEIARGWLTGSGQTHFVIADREEWNDEWSLFPERDQDEENYRNMPLGTVRTFPAITNEHGTFPERTIEALTVADLLDRDPSWPLPTYLPPEPGVRVGLHTWFEDHGSRSYIELEYTVLEGQRIFLAISRDPGAAQGSDAHRVFLDPADAELFRYEQILVSGVPATVLVIEEQHYWIWWQYPEGMIVIGGSVALDDLVKALDSMAPHSGAR